MRQTVPKVANGGYRFSPNWRISAAAEHGRTKRDFDELEWLNATSLTARLTHRTPLANEIGGEIRGTRGEARVEVPVGGDEVSFVDDHDQTEVAAILSYALGAQLRIGGRLGYTRAALRRSPKSL